MTRLRSLCKTWREELDYMWRVDAIQFGLVYAANRYPDNFLTSRADLIVSTTASCSRWDPFILYLIGVLALRDLRATDFTNWELIKAENINVDELKLIGHAAYKILWKDHVKKDSRSSTSFVARDMSRRVWALDN